MLQKAALHTGLSLGKRCWSVFCTQMCQ